MIMKKQIIIMFVLLTSVLYAGTGYTAEKRTVIYWDFRPGNVEEYRERQSDIEDRFNIKLEIRVVSQSVFAAKLKEAVDSGKGKPDLIMWVIENNRIIDHDPKRSLLMPLDRFIPKSRAKKIVPEGRIDWLRYGKHIYGLPHDVHSCLLVYNDTIWKSVGVDLAKIETWDEFFGAAKKLAAVTENGKQKYYALPYGSAGEFNKKKEDASEDGLNNTMFLIWQQSGAPILDEKGNPRFTSPEFRAFLEKWLEWRKSGAFTNWDWGSFGSNLNIGRYASYISPDWWIPQVNLASTGSTEGAEDALHGKKIKRVGVKYQFRVRLLPTYQKGGSKSASWGGAFIGIPKGTKDPSKAVKRSRKCMFNGKYVTTPVYDSEKLKAGNVIVGPAIIEVPTTTAVIPHNYQCKVDEYNNYILTRRP